MADHLSKVRAKGLENTGVTEEHAKRLFNRGPGTYMLAVVELQVARLVGPDTEGKRVTELVISQFEPVETDHPSHDVLSEFVRGLARQRRVESGDQEALPGTEGTVGPSLDDATRALSAHVERDDEGRVVGVWTGDPDAPTSEETFPGPTPPADAGDPDAPDPQPNDGDDDATCSYPGCQADEDHDGDHEVPDDDPDAVETTE